MSGQMPNAYKAQWRRNRFASMSDADKETLRSRNRDWMRRQRELDGERVSANKRRRYQDHKAEISAARRTPAARSAAAAYVRSRRQSDMSFRLVSNLRRRLWREIAQRKTRKSARTKELIGCDLAALRSHLEAKFLPGMAWSNYGEWHIDHIRPCASFDLTDPEQQKACFHYMNLQPLWARENQSKGGRVA